MFDLWVISFLLDHMVLYLHFDSKSRIRLVYGHLGKKIGPI